jgi:hypothetical protein
MVNGGLISDVIPGRAAARTRNLVQTNAGFPDVQLHICGLRLWRIPNVEMDYS